MQDRASAPAGPAASVPRADVSPSLPTCSPLPWGSAHEHSLAMATSDTANAWWDDKGREGRTGVLGCPLSLPAPHPGHHAPKASGTREHSISPPQHPAAPKQAVAGGSLHPALPTLLLSPLDPNTTATSARLPRCSRRATAAGKAGGATTEHNAAIDGRAGGPSGAQ